MTPEPQTIQKTKLIYVYDALCGWCYGFSPTMEKFAKVHQEEIEVEVWSGGMVTGERIGPIGEVAGYISQAYKQVEQATGITFGDAFLNGTMKEGTAIFTSVPPSIAMTILKEAKPEEQLAFASSLQKAIYFDGMEPNDTAGYGKIAASYGLHADEFVQKMSDSTYLAKTQKEFSYVEQMGVTGFPTLFLVQDDFAYVLGRGAQSYEALEKEYTRVLKEMADDKK